MDTTAAERAGGLKYCDYYGLMTYADFLEFALIIDARSHDYAISERKQ